MSCSLWRLALTGTAMLTAVVPASAQVVGFDRTMTQGASPLLTDVQFRGGGRRFHRGGFGNRGYGYGGGHHRGWRGGRGAAIGAGVAGLAAGALIGGALATQGRPAYGYDGGYGGPGYAGYPGYAADPGYGYATPPVQVGDASGYCAGRFKSYDPRSGTYLGYDGARHPCP